MHTNTHTHIYIYAYTHMHTHTHTNRHMYMDTNTHGLHLFIFPLHPPPCPSFTLLSVHEFIMLCASNREGGPPFQSAHTHTHTHTYAKQETQQCWFVSAWCCPPVGPSPSTHTLFTDCTCAPAGNGVACIPVGTPCVRSHRMCEKPHACIHVHILHRKSAGLCACVPPCASVSVHTRPHNKNTHGTTTVSHVLSFMLAAECCSCRTLTQSCNRPTPPTHTRTPGMRNSDTQTTLTRDKTRPTPQQHCMVGTRKREQHTHRRSEEERESIYIYVCECTHKHKDAPQTLHSLVFSRFTVSPVVRNFEHTFEHPVVCSISLHRQGQIDR